MDFKKYINEVYGEHLGAEEAEDIEERELKPGDRVKYIGNDEMVIGKTGTMYNVHQMDKNYFGVKFDKFTVGHSWSGISNGWYVLSNELKRI